MKEDLIKKPKKGNKDYVGFSLLCDFPIVINMVKSGLLKMKRICARKFNEVPLSQKSSITEYEAFHRSYPRVLVIEFYRTFGNVHILCNHFLAQFR